jgi:hypothetical protein
LVGAMCLDRHISPRCSDRWRALRTG